MAEAAAGTGAATSPLLAGRWVSLFGCALSNDEIAIEGHVEAFAVFVRPGGSYLVPEGFVAFFDSFPHEVDLVRGEVCVFAVAGSCFCHLEKG